VQPIAGITVVEDDLAPVEPARDAASQDFIPLVAVQIGKQA
jgi:hypothetical protein